MNDFGPVSVNAATGNMVFGWSSRTVATLGGGSSVSLSYNSLYTQGTAVLDATPGLPFGWQGSWGDLPVTSAEIEPGGSFVVRMADGSREAFSWNDNNDRWEPVEETVFSIATNTTGGKVQWQHPSGWTVEFNSNGTIDSAVSKSDDTAPAALEFHWDTVGGQQRLTSITDPTIQTTTREMAFLYGGQNGCPASPPTGLLVAPSGLLCQVTHMDGSIIVPWYVTSGGVDPVDQIARIVEDVNGDLGTGTDDEIVWDFGWNTGHQMETIRTPQANRLIDAAVFTDSAPGHVIDIGYDTDLRVESLTGELPDSTHVRPEVSYDYDTTNRITTVDDANRTEPNSYTIKYYTDDRGRGVQTQDRLGRSSFTRWETRQQTGCHGPTPSLATARTRTVWMRTGTVYDHRGRPIESWGPANRTEFDNATSESTGTASGGASTPLSETDYDGGLEGSATSYWDRPGLGCQPAVHGYLRG